MLRSRRFLLYLILTLLIPEPRVSAGTALNSAKNLTTVDNCKDLLSDLFLPTNKISHETLEHYFVEGVPLDGPQHSPFAAVEIQRSNPTTQYVVTKQSTDLPDKYQTYFDLYFKILREQRNFTEERIKNFQTLEKQIPNYRKTISVQRSLVTGEVIGIVRIVEGTESLPVSYLTRKSGENQKITNSLSRFPNSTWTDKNYKLPYERSLESRGLKSTLIDEERRRPYSHRIFEIGRAYRQKGTVQGEEAKALWELDIAHFVMTTSEDNRDTFVIHTDRPGAILFQRTYHADIQEAVIPLRNSNPGEPRFKLRRQKEILPDDPPDTEYALFINAPYFARDIFKSFQSDPIKAKMLEDKNSYISEMMEDLRYYLTTPKFRVIKADGGFPKLIKTERKYGDSTIDFETSESGSSFQRQEADN